MNEKPAVYEAVLKNKYVIKRTITKNMPANKFSTISKQRFTVFNLNKTKVTKLTLLFLDLCYDSVL